MKVELTNIYHGRSTKRFSIFSIDHKDDYIATGSINGEMKIYYKEKAQTYKNHKNAVLCVRFDPYSDLLASGSDDNTIIVYKKTNSVYKKVASFETHTSDVSCICWHKSFLVSAGYDGQIFLYEKETFNVIRKVKAFDICYGVIANNDHLICQSDKEIRVYDFSLNLIKTVDTLFCGNIVEAFFARNSFNFGCKYLAVCLAHNNKANSVEVLNDSYEQQFSLIGHVAPIEAVSFFPNMLCKDDKYYNLIAVGSQDKSISFWISDNPNPFLLLKNAFEQPILDMFWKGYVLYVASYDGTVKTFTFSDEEIGKEVFYIENYEEFDDIPLIVENESKKMTESSISMSKESNTKKPNEIKLQDEKQSICMDKQSIKKSKRNRPEKQNPIAKRIKPVLVNQAQPEDIIKPVENQELLYIFPSGNERFTKIKRKAGIERIDLRIAEFEISVISKEKSILTVLRAGKVFYTHSFEKIYLFKANRNYIAMVIKDSTFDSLLTYQLETGLIHLPAISMQRIAFIDLLKHSLLIALGESTIQIINLKTKKCTVEAKLPITNNLKSIVLHDKYNIIALYDFGSYIYHYKTKLWFKKNKSFSTIMYKSTDMNFDESDEVDETFDELEYNFRIYELLEDKCKMIAIAEKMVKYSLNLKTFDEIVYNKFLYVFKSLKNNGENRKTVLLLEMMNSNCILQPAVFEMANFFKSQSK